MSKYREKAAALRAQKVPHINCAQAVVIPFAEELGIPEETAMKFADGFGGGMKQGSVCGAVTGGIMALGLYGKGDPDSLALFHQRFMEKHQDMLNCAELLKANADAGNEKKPFCDGMVLECVDLVEEMISCQI